MIIVLKSRYGNREVIVDTTDKKSRKRALKSIVGFMDREAAITKMKDNSSTMFGSPPTAWGEGFAMFDNRPTNWDYLGEQLKQLKKSLK